MSLYDMISFHSMDHNHQFMDIFHIRIILQSVCQELVRDCPDHRIVKGYKRLWNILKQTLYFCPFKPFSFLRTVFFFHQQMHLKLSVYLSLLKLLCLLYWKGSSRPWNLVRRTNCLQITLKMEEPEQIWSDTTVALACLLVPLEAGFALTYGISICLVANRILSAWICFLSAYISAGNYK